MGEIFETTGLLEKWEGPAIMLLDLDAFFASVEQLDHPEWRGKPVIVGGDPDARGVVSTCSYEARKYGVRSAMPSSTAARLCPDAYWTHGNHARYKEVSNRVMDIIRDETPFVQQVSIDEAFADITPTRANTEHPALVARRIQKKVSELGVTCSIGLGATKSVAKIASEADKPRGLTVVFPGSERSFMAELPVRALSGVGPSAEVKLHSAGINTLGEMADADEALLNKIFGVAATEMRLRACGQDFSPVETERNVKSVSHEVSFAKDLEDEKDIRAVLVTLLGKVGRRLRAKGLKGTTVYVKIRFDDRSVRNAQSKLPAATDDDIALRPYVIDLVKRLWRPGQKVRLLGVGVSGFDAMPEGQQSLLDELGLNDGEISLKSQYGAYEDEDMRKSLLEAVDSLKDKFGEDVVGFGSSLRNGKNTTNTSASNNPGGL